MRPASAIAPALTVLVVSAATAGALLESRGGGLAPAEGRDPVTVVEQGSFAIGGVVMTAANGDTSRGDHAYVQYQIPAHAKRYPLVMWHGGAQSSKTWETTPDGRDGYQNIFLRVETTPMCNTRFRRARGRCRW